MAISINRRNAIAAAFNQYPDVLEQFATRHCQLRDLAGEAVPMVSRYERAVMQICMAQFCVRLLQTRAKNANSSSVENFVTDCIERYHGFHRKLLGGMIIEADKKYRMAVEEVERHMAGLVLHALSQEVMIDEQAAKKQNIPLDFDEASFWHDVFLALSQNQSKKHPLWITPIQEVVLNHLDEFKNALDPV